jgi:hypothetical protein
MKFRKSAVWGTINLVAWLLLRTTITTSTSTKGTLVAVSGFTKPARDLAAAEPQLELIDWPELFPLLDESLGAEWSRDVDWVITRSRSRTGVARTSPGALI